MPAFFLIFLLFCLWLFYERRKAKRSEELKSASFWEKESKADATRRQDTSDLSFIYVDFDALPFDDSTNDIEAKMLQDRLLNLRGQKICDLSAYSNTDLKLKYGRPNFDALCAAEENYHLLLATLSDWGILLHRENKYDEALTVFEAALKYGSHAITVYTGIANVYASMQRPDKIEELISTVSNTEMTSCSAVLTQLRDVLASVYAGGGPLLLP